MLKKRIFLVCNWKMNPNTEDEAVRLAEQLKSLLLRRKNIATIVCPPYLFLNKISSIFGKQKDIFVGAQDVFSGEGSMTGEVGPEMLVNSNVKYCIIGHSSRRDVCESDEEVADKIAKIIKKGITAILCVGEKERNESGSYFNFVKIQIEKALSKIKKTDLSKIIIAYEPVWAIGKKESEALTPEELFEMTIFIKKTLVDSFDKISAEKVSILYGGSVTKGNGLGLLSKGNIKGLLIGRESIKIENFSALIEQIEDYMKKGDTV